MSRTISVCSWEAFQHYKDRDPPWIKLYRDVLTTESWVLGTDHSRLVQVAITLLAARYHNAIPLHHSLLRKVGSLDMSDQELESALQHLHAHKFLEIKGEENIASTPLATCPSEAEQSRAEQRRAEKSRADTSASATPERRAGEKVSRGTEPEESEWFLDFKLAYPDRAGDQGWRKAERAGKARMREGHFPREFIAGARRYGEFCEATKKLGTEFVKQAASFLGPDKPFLLPWTLPAQPETAMEEIQRLNGGHHASAGRIFDADQSATGLVPLFGAVRR